MQHGHVVADYGGLADYHAGGVVDENALAELSGWVDVDLKHLERMCGPSDVAQLGVAIQLRSRGGTQV